MTKDQPYVAGYQTIYHNHARRSAADSAGVVLLPPLQPRTRRAAVPLSGRQGGAAMSRPIAAPDAALGKLPIRAKLASGLAKRVAGPKG
jgi:hypothetical protein